MSRKAVDKSNVYAEVLHDISEGLSLRKACEKHRVSACDFRKQMRENEKLQSQYARAREDATDAIMDEFDMVMGDLKAGTIDSSSARVLLDALKWKLCKFYPKMYGDMNKMQIVDDKGTAINPFEAFYKAVCDKKDYTR